jgi:hypothetical protein
MFNGKIHGKIMEHPWKSTISMAIFKFANGKRLPEGKTPEAGMFLDPARAMTHLTHLGPLDRPTWRCFAPGWYRSWRCSPQFAGDLCDISQILKGTEELRDQNVSYDGGGWSCLGCLSVKVVFFWITVMLLTHHRIHVGEWSTGDTQRILDTEIVIEQCP